MLSYRYSEIQPDAPRPSETPYESITHQSTDSHKVWDDYAPILIGVPVGFVASYWSNYMNQRPRFSRIPKMIFTMGMLTAVLEGFQRLRIYRQAEQEVIVREYMELHPDDFPPFERKKFKDVFMDWTPIR